MYREDITYRHDSPSYSSTPSTSSSSNHRRRPPPPPPRLPSSTLSYFLVGGPIASLDGTPSKAVEVWSRFFHLRRRQPMIMTARSDGIDQQIINLTIMYNNNNQYIQTRVATSVVVVLRRVDKSCCNTNDDDIISDEGGCAAGVVYKITFVGILICLLIDKKYRQYGYHAPNAHSASV